MRLRKCDQLFPNRRGFLNNAGLAAAGSNHGDRLLARGRRASRAARSGSSLTAGDVAIIQFWAEVRECDRGTLYPTQW